MGERLTDYSEAFYSKHARRYAEVAHDYLQSIYTDSSHPKLKGDMDLLDRLKELAPGRRGLDAGCGAGARDVYQLWRDGFDVQGVDAVARNVVLAEELHPEIGDRVSVHDLRRPLPFPDEHFDFVICNAVIQHIEPEHVFEVVLHQFARVLRPGGVLQLMFKNGRGTITVYDKDFCAQRCFRLYDENEIIEALEEENLSLIETEGDALGGVMFFTDPKSTRHCVFFMRKNT